MEGELIVDLRAAVPLLSHRISDVDALALAVDVAEKGWRSAMSALRSIQRVREGAPDGAEHAAARRCRRTADTLESAKASWRAAWIAEGRLWRSPE